MDKFILFPKDIEIGKNVVLIKCNKCGWSYVKGRPHTCMEGKYNLMKTDTQITIKSLEVGKKFYEEKVLSPKCDIIDISAQLLDEKWEYLLNIKDKESFSLLPFIQNGILQIKGEKEDSYYKNIYLFNSSMEENNLLLHIDFISLMNMTQYKEAISKKWMYEPLFINEKTGNGIKRETFSLWEGSCTLAIPNEILFNYCPNKHTDCYSIVSFSDAKTEIYTKQQRKEEDICSYIDGKVDVFNEMILSDFFTCIIWTNYLLKHPEEKEIKKQRNDTKRVSKRKENQPEKTQEDIIREVNLNGIRIRSKNKQTISRIKSKTKAYTMASWTVRGHIRQYKSGKVVYVKPFIKGKDASKRIIKQYNISE